jgi:formylglycine-generating enzyme required for sulfatase activity
MTTVVIDQDGVERAYPPEQGPIVVGGSVRCAVQIPEAGPADEPLLLGLSGDKPFAQRGPRGAEVNIGSAPLTGSVWLQDGDRIQVGTVWITCRISQQQVSYRVGHGAADDATLPPLTLMPPDATDTIAPRPFTPPVAAPVQVRRRAWPRLLLTLLAMLVGAVLWFTFSARSVQLTIEPAADEVSIRGGPLAFLGPVPRFGDRYLLLPGGYRLRASLTGYHTLEQPFQVDESDAQQQRFELLKLPGRISFHVVPAEGARIYLDGDLLGESPLAEIDVPAGEHAVRVEADRYLAHEQSLSVVGMGEPQGVDIELTPGWSAVEIRSEPPGAALTVDGEEQGVTPLTVDLMAGQHDLTLSLSGYGDWNRSLTVAANEPLVVPVTLQPAAATVALSSRPDGASVRVDGDYQGRTPITLSLTPDLEHRLQLSKAGHADLDQTLSLRPGEARELALDLTPRLGTVRLKVSPADAGVWVDGRSRGKGDQTLRLSTAPHRIEVRREGHVSQTLSVTPRSGIAQDLKMVLKPVSAKPPAAGAGIQDRGSAPLRPPTAVPGAARVSTPDGQTLIRIPPGRLTLGSSRREQGRRSNERLREVTLTRPFYLAERETTNAEFRRFRPGHRSGSMGGQSLDLDNQPVVNVTWQDAAAYANWMSQKASLPPAYVQQGGRLVPAQPMTRGYRLPTEAEWAWAARQANTGARIKYYWGANWPPTGKPGNFGDEQARTVIGSVLPGYDDGFPVAAPVGQFPGNRLGLRDMEGNVSEWANDFYGVTPGGGRTATDPMGPGSGRHHVIRGASWRHGGISELRISFRDYDSDKRPDVGFRLARYAD